VGIKSIRAAFQGERGAFSEEVALQSLEASVDALPFRTFDEMFAAVAAGTADFAVAPVENTLAGSVIRTYDLLLEHQLVIVGEAVLRIVHNLIAPPGVELTDIRRVLSHPVALAQCERFLQAHPHLDAVQAYDTAGSVKLVVEGGRKDEAAIASERAAQAWGARILLTGIESNPKNFTRFVLLVRPDRVERLPLRAADRPYKTSIVFRIAHQPGALHQALAAFADTGISPTKIESRPIEGRPFEYSFYVDVLGPRDSAAVKAGLDSLAAQAESLRILGSYPRAPGFD
jgi:prephenate dehydratase